LRVDWALIPKGEYGTEGEKYIYKLRDQRLKPWSIHPFHSEWLIELYQPAVPVVSYIPVVTGAGIPCNAVVIFQYCKIGMEIFF
jgi:hypothetical protein